MLSNNTNNKSHDQNFSIPMTPIDHNNFSDFFDSNDFIFPENTQKSFESKQFLQSDPENLSSLLTFCNQTLSNYGFSPLGELQGPINEINKTIKVIYELLQQRQRDLEFRSEIIDKIAKLESDKNSISQNVIRLKSELEAINKENGVLQNNNKTLEKKYKTDKEKLIFEKEEINKQLSKLAFKETQMLHEIRKKENETNKYKEQMKKTIEKNAKVQHEILNNFSQNINGNYSKLPGDNIFLSEIKEIHENLRHKLIQENQELRNTLAIVHNEMNHLLADKKEIFMKKLLNESKENENLKNWFGKYFSDINVIVIKPEIFSMPYDKIGNDIVNLFKSNFKVFDAFFNKIVDFNYFQHYFREIKHELSEFYPNLGHSSSLKEFKTALIKIKKPETLSQNNSLKTLKNEENKENLNEKSKSIIVIDDKKSIMDLSMRHFSKPFVNSIHASSAGLKKKNPSMHTFEKPAEETDILEISKEINRWEDCFKKKYGN